MGIYQDLSEEFIIMRWFGEGASTREGRAYQDLSAYRSGKAQAEK